jgi:hypothetical protein
VAHAPVNDALPDFWCLALKDTEIVVGIRICDVSVELGLVLVESSLQRTNSLLI